MEVGRTDIKGSWKMDGILNINKPPGKTSFDIVAKVRRMTKVRRVGHAGTLDPDATGVLPVCLGQATRVVEFLQDATKTYRAEIEFGASTDTYDASGRIVEKGDPSGITEDVLKSALESFRGVITQTPPVYSAVKYHGKPLYELARAGVTVQPKARTAVIHGVKLVDCHIPLATIEVVCGKGTYIRSLAHDLGQKLGCGAFLKSLTRLAYGPFTVEEAVSMTELEVAISGGYWQQYLHPIDIVFSHWKAVILSEDSSQRIKHGRAIVLPPEVGGDSPDSEGPRDCCRAYDPDGRFLAVLRFDPNSREWLPHKVFARPADGPSPASEEGGDTHQDA